MTTTRTTTTSSSSPTSARRSVSSFPEDDEGFPGETAREESGQFAGGDFEADGGEANVEGGVALVEEEGDLDEVFELFRDDRLDDCLLEAMEASLEAQADDDTPPVENLSFDTLDEPSVGDEGVAFAVTGDILGFPFGSVITFVREGRVAAFFTETSVGDGPDLDEDELLELLLDEATAGELARRGCPESPGRLRAGGARAVSMTVATMRSSRPTHRLVDARP